MHIDVLANRLTEFGFINERDAFLDGERITFWGNKCEEFALVNNGGNYYLSSDILDVVWVGSEYHTPAAIAVQIISRYVNR